MQCLLKKFQFVTDFIYNNINTNANIYLMHL